MGGLLGTDVLKDSINSALNISYLVRTVQLQFVAFD